jgi:hypothetical protein
MRKPSKKPTESKCPACNGTGYPVVMQPMQPGRKIYRAPCKKCGGKGRTTEPARPYFLSFRTRSISVSASLIAMARLTPSSLRWSALKFAANFRRARPDQCPLSGAERKTFARVELYRF